MYLECVCTKFHVSISHGNTITILIPLWISEPVRHKWFSIDDDNGEKSLLVEHDFKKAPHKPDSFSQDGITLLF